MNKDKVIYFIIALFIKFFSFLIFVHSLNFLLKNILIKMMRTNSFLVLTFETVILIAKNKNCIDI